MKCQGQHVCTFLYADVTLRGGPGALEDRRFRGCRTRHSDRLSHSGAVQCEQAPPAMLDDGGDGILIIVQVAIVMAVTKFGLGALDSVWKG